MKIYYRKKRISCIITDFRVLDIICCRIKTFLYPILNKLKRLLMAK